MSKVVQNKTPWSEIIDRYAEVSGDLRQTFLHPALLKEINSTIVHKGRCLDFGCGPGDLSVTLAHIFEDLVMVDTAPRALEKAVGRVGTKVSALSPERFADTSDLFDAIIFSLVLTTIEQDEYAATVLSGLARRLCDDGQLIIGTTHPCFTFRALSQVPYSSSGKPYNVTVEAGLDIIEFHRPLERIVGLLTESNLTIRTAREIYDNESYYLTRGEEPHRFAGILPLFLILVCEKKEGLRL